MHATYSLSDTEMALRSQAGFPNKKVRKILYIPNIPNLSVILGTDSDAFGVTGGRD